MGDLAASLRPEPPTPSSRGIAATGSKGQPSPGSLSLRERLCRPAFGPRARHASQPTPQISGLRRCRPKPTSASRRRLLSRSWPVVPLVRPSRRGLVAFHLCVSPNVSQPSLPTEVSLSPSKFRAASAETEPAERESKGGRERVAGALGSSLRGALISCSRVPLLLGS